MTNLEVVQNREVARPLKILIPLIKNDIERGDEAGMEFYKAAGEKLNEAETHFDSNRIFYQWAEKEFGKSRRTIDTWMVCGAAKSPNLFKSLEDVRVKSFGEKRPVQRNLRREWVEPVDAIADKARDEQRRLIASEHVSRQQEREAKFKLKLRIIDIGYKVLARELHPDKVGGSREAMTRLNEARNELKANA